METPKNTIKGLANNIVITETEENLNKYFGNINEIEKHLVTIDLPYPMRLSWDLNTTTKRLTVNKAVADSVVRVLTKVLNYYGYEKIKELGLDILGGAFNKRKKRGGNTWSVHAWGIAIDFNPDKNRLKWGKNKAEFAKPIYKKWWEFWYNEGWYSLGIEKNYDYMHVQKVKPI